VLVPIAQSAPRDLFFYVASGAPPATAGPAVRRAVTDLDPNLPIFDIKTLQAQYDLSNWPVRVFGGLFMTFGFAALLMAAAGLYGVMSFAVRRRTQEIGVRMALGADRRRIIRMVVRQGVWQVGVGVALGFGLGGLLGAQMNALLFRVAPWDPIVFGVTIAVLSTAGLLASIIPALRAASVDPLVALRHD
jgi:putative ABC transport system permease protein